MEIKSITVMAKAAFNKNLSTSEYDLKLRKNLVKCCTWSIALCGAETGTVRAEYQKYLGISEMWCWRRMEVSWTDCLRNEEVLQTVKGGQEYPTYNKCKEILMDWSHLV